MTQLTIQQALQVAEQLLGRAPERLEPFRPAAGGDTSFNFRLWPGAEPMLLKVMRSPDLPVGVYFHRRIQAAGVPAPDLISFDAHAGPDGQACAIWEWIDGVHPTWREGEQCPYDEAELGEMCRRIHDLEFEGEFGYLGDDLSRRTFSESPDLAPVSSTWPGFFLCDRAAKRLLVGGFITEAEAEVLATLPQRVGRPLADAPCRLLHMADMMHGSNLILDPKAGRIRALLDYVESAAGDPRWELAFFDFYFAQIPEDAGFNLARFRAAYGTEHDADDVLGRFYLAAMLVFMKSWYFTDPNDARGPWALQTLKDILAELAH